MNRRYLLSAVAGLTLMLAGIFVPFMKDAVDAGLARSARTALASKGVTGVTVGADWASLTLEGHPAARRPALAAVHAMAHHAAVHQVTYRIRPAAHPAPRGNASPAPSPKTPPKTNPARNPSGLETRIRAALGKDGVTFAAGSARLTAPAKAALGRVASLLDQRSGLRATVIIAGFTDNRGGARANRALSLARADAIRDYLTEHGVDGGHLKTVGRGETSPVAANATAAGRAANRRIEFTVQGS